MSNRFACFALALALFAPAAFAQPLLITEKKFFTLPQYTTQGGKQIKNVRVGYETYGKLNAAGTNVVFVAHFFSGTSHAAGRYTLVNLNVKSPMVGTSGPATTNPDTGKPYGASFPVVSIADFVRVHKALLDSLGVKKLAAAAGASMGSLQAMQWAAEYPDFVERVIHVIGPGLDVHPYVIEFANVWASPIRLDPNWKGGDYYGGAEPTEGLAQALTLVSFTTVHFSWAEKVHGYKWAAEGKNPGDAMGNLFAIEDSLQKSGQARAAASDAGHFVWLVKANQLYNLEKEQARIKAKVLFLPAKTDLLFPPELSRRSADKLRAQGNQVEFYEIDGTSGHLDGLFSIGKVADRIGAFMQK